MSDQINSNPLLQHVYLFMCQPHSPSLPVLDTLDRSSRQALRTFVRFPKQTKRSNFKTQTLADGIFYLIKQPFVFESRGSPKKKMCKHLI